MADCAHLGFEITALYDNLDFTWSGYNDSLQNYINESLHRLKAMEQ
jgi:secreted Zn-dependent insulinase-like peptidase